MIKLILGRIGVALAAAAILATSAAIFVVALAFALYALVKPTVGPVTAIAAAIATGFFAIRNPRYLGVAVRSFLEGSDPETKRRR